MCFGILIALESFGAILTGWVNKNLIAPELHFPFIGFEWLQPLPGVGMYLYFGVMGMFGVLVALGYRYRLSIFLFTVLWTGAYLMQKTAYNNHYYLLILLSILMCLFPANGAIAMDVRRRPEIETHTMYSWIKWIVVVQLWIVYTFAAIAKLYPDWINLAFLTELMAPKSDYPLIGGFLQLPWVQYAIVWFGIFYDFTVIPFMLWKRTRKAAFFASILFHLFNAITLHIGIFPFLSLALMAFFFEPETLRSLFFRKKPITVCFDTFQPPLYSTWITVITSIYVLVQIALPLRHHLISGDVLWTEEGHRMSWRMMLRNRQGRTYFKVVDRKSGVSESVKLQDVLTVEQQAKVMAHPDFMWQFAQHLKTIYRQKGKDIAVYARSTVRINNRPFFPFTDETVDLASVKWDPFKHAEWILPPPPNWPGTEKLVKPAKAGYK